MLEFIGAVIKLLIVWTLISIPASLLIAKFLSISKQSDLRQRQVSKSSRDGIHAYRTEPSVGE